MRRPADEEVVDALSPSLADAGHRQEARAAMAIEQRARQRGAGLVERAAIDPENPAGLHHRHGGVNVPGVPAVDEGAQQAAAVTVAGVRLAELETDEAERLDSSHAGGGLPRGRRLAGGELPGGLQDLRAGGIVGAHAVALGQAECKGPEVAQDAAGRDRRQLVGVADQHEARLGAQRPRELLDQHQVDHRRLVDDDTCVRQPIVLVVAEGASVQRSARGESQQAVERARRGRLETFGGEPLGDPVGRLAGSSAPRRRSCSWPASPPRARRGRSRR